MTEPQDSSLSSLRSRSRLAIHTITTKPWSLEQACENYAAQGIPGISIWIEAMEGRRAVDVKKLVDDHGLRVPALVRGGFFCDPSGTQRAARIDANRKLIEQAAALGAEMLVLVVGAVPGCSLQDQRTWVRDAVEQLVPMAESYRVKLAVEPLHPMYSGDRSCINTLAQARKLCTAVDHAWLGVAVDVYHVWWDEHLESEILQLGNLGKLFAFHLCDWRVPTRDLLNDRALMGDGCIDLRTIRRWVHEAGFNGWEEVEIFSTDHWAENQAKFLSQIISRYEAL